MDLLCIKYMVDEITRTISWAGPSFLAMLVFEKFGQHQPLNRQAERFAREGVPLSFTALFICQVCCCA